MPARVQKRGNRYRVVHGRGTLVKRHGKAVDGGGHRTRAGATRQARAINAK